METEFMDQEVKERHPSRHTGRFLFAGILLVASLLIAKEQNAEKKTAEQ